MTINVKWNTECQFKITTNKGFELNVDANNQAAPCPTELLLSALGSCSATDVVLQLQQQGYAIQSLQNEVSYTLTDEEPRLYKTANLHFSVKAPNMTEAVIIEAANQAIEKYCHVCLMLSPTIEISVSATVLLN
ncbi:OsmC family protein [Vibrio taketomensis]|uniref:OsmC family protein n=1 Tax=Vibrio taketomensis TaxID=2572923 RepID=UPI00138A63C9|nr:OsmC family protein [Vibrio taketomensis]